MEEKPGQKENPWVPFIDVEKQGIFYCIFI
jgi:hypothetical protein